VIGKGTALRGSKKNETPARAACSWKIVQSAKFLGKPSGNGIITKKLFRCEWGGGGVPARGKKTKENSFSESMVCQSEEEKNARKTSEPMSLQEKIDNTGKPDRILGGRKSLKGSQRDGEASSSRQKDRPGGVKKSTRGGKAAFLRGSQSKAGIEELVDQSRQKRSYREYPVAEIGWGNRRDLRYGHCA